MNNITDAQADALIALVRDTAARVILPRFRQLAEGEVEAKSDPTDLVTVADREAEALLSDGVAEILPGCAVVGEEAVEEDPSLLAGIAGAETCVIIDPVDGTGNFARGVAVFGVILAVTRHGETVFGLLYDPVCDDWVMAHRGDGAWYVTTQGRRRLATRAVRQPAEAEGMIPLCLVAPGDRASLLQPYAVVRSVQSLRCSCHEYRLLAMGQVDFVSSLSLKPWDHAAGQLVLAEAGGASVLEDGSPYRPTRHEGRSLSASSAQMLARLRDAGLPGPD